MNYIQKKAAILLSFALCLLLAFPAHSQDACSIPSPKNQLARDQRDDLRLKCLNQKKRQLSFSQCLRVADSMEYSTNAEDARILCLFGAKQAPSMNECLSLSAKMEYPDSGDEVRWECLRRFNRSLSTKKCQDIAKKMSYPANTQRAELYCREELE